MYVTQNVLIKNIFWLVVLIKNRAPNKNKFNYSQTTANYLIIFQDN